MHLNGTSMSAAMVTAGAALLIQANPKITPAQLKIRLQTGSTFMRDGGLVGGGAGSVNFWSTRKSSANTGLLSNLVSTLVGGILAPSSGATFWDSGTMSNRLYARTGIRLLSLLELPFALLTPGYLKWGDLNLVGANNSLASEEPNQIIWGDVSTWTPNNQIIWGDTIYNPEGQQIIWGDSSVSEDDQIIWGDSTLPERHGINEIIAPPVRAAGRARRSAGYLESLVSLTTTAHPYEWLLFAALAMLTGSFSLKIASISASVTVSDTFFITTALLFGPAPATLAVALDTCIISYRRKHSLDRVAFNAATPALGMWAGSHVFFIIAGIPHLSQSHTPIQQLILPMVALTTVYFLVNSGLIALAIGLDARKSPIDIWRQHFSWLSVNYFAAASVALCLVLLIHQVSFSAALVVLPLLVVLHLTLRASFGRLDDARSHLAHLDKLYLSTVETLAMAIDAKDDVTHSHVRRVQAYALGLARELGVTDEPTLKAIEAAALLHDTGKLAVPEHILNKPGKLRCPSSSR